MLTLCAQHDVLQAMLEEDALSFDAFLKENDEKVQEAIKRADVEAKSKQDKVLEIKRLNTAIAALRSELNKQKEALEECKRYKEFLDGVTPKEWFATQAAKQEQARQEQIDAWRAECDAVKARKEAAAAARAKAEADYSNARTQQEAERAEKAIKEATAALKEALKAKEPPAPVFDDSNKPGPNESSIESMYFTQPEQLLQVYADLAESNLFLIQVCQESEEQLEEIKGHYRHTQEQMNAEVAGLQVLPVVTTQLCRYRTVHITMNSHGTLEARFSVACRKQARIMQPAQCMCAFGC
eukprot:GHUV01040997.1.p1 GENE.GHUV01040997.1~~GHUV01040997.1.p1  ORF type:complete len:297 (+),score=87.78 GHUV01040997.1:82-972(+)